MCGIAGLLNFDRRVEVVRDVIEGMNRAMGHRGPNDAGCYLDGHVGLGNRRLSIIDLPAGHQPLANEDGTIWITYNGEIYNYSELRVELVAKGHVFKTAGDTEVIVHLYEDMAEKCVERLVGMFAFAIWDKRNQTLLLARDRLGIKPLYYFQGPEFLAFSSEIRALLQVPAIRPRLNLQALHDYLTLHYTVAPQTMLEGIRKLEPGHILLARGREVRREQYWDLDYSPKLLMPERVHIDEFYERFKSTTRSHLVGEVPLGILLSGGLDSTAVTAVVSELTGRRVKTFSVAFAGEGDSYDERRYARLVARYYDTDHHEIAITRKDFATGLRDYIWSMEEPMADPASVPLFYVSKLAKNHVTIILSGEGSDELLGGYFGASDFRGFTRARWIRRIPGPLRKHVLKPLNDRFIQSPRVRRYLELSDRPLSHYLQVVPMYMGSNVFSEEAKWAIYGPRMRSRDGFRPSEDIVVDGYRQAAELDFVDQILHVYMKQWLPDDLLLKADKMTMAHSLELRVPFLDHTFVEFVARLPVDMKVRRNGGRSYVTKYVLRRAFEGKMPREILERPKLGFQVPLKSLFQGELRTMAGDVFESRVVKESGLFEMGNLRALLEQHDAGADHCGQLWRLLVLGVWLDLFKVAP